MAQRVAGEMYYELDGQLLEIKRQLRQLNGYPYDPQLLKDFLQRGIEGRFETVVRNFPVWRTLVIGGKSKDELIGELASKGCDVSNWAKDIISKPQFTTLAKKKTIYLARAKVGNLGFTEQPTTKEIWSRIKEIGALCPAEVGPHLRLALEDQPNGDYFWVAMEQITDSLCNPSVFDVERRDGGERWLDGYYTHSGHRWYLSREIVFVLRK